ncbi:protealysin inhibitor emfourin [Pseudomonas sp. RIT-PI-S]|uniref:protealysin inhibitor emfourin n=1 Tax=Pseudomonas sp. RIT-PI-S TaxID=3035295 RepID=UPI0021D8F489|nr:protealysin inhibitor emfourin [Pseudomonas sp. RIT-PI-S]
MRISYCETGGMAYFPGLNKPRTLDVSALPAPDQQELRQLVEASRFFALPQSRQPAAAPRGAQHYTLTVSEGEREHTVCLLAPVKDGPLQGLVQCVRRHIND